MNRFTWFAGPRPLRPMRTPTAMSLLAIGGLLAVALLLPDRAVDQASAAVDTPAIVVAPARPNQKITLRDRLLMGLEARLKSEVEFVELVVLRVQAGELPERLVNETFFWARQRARVGRQGNIYRPIVFFQPALKLRAERLKIEL